MSVAEQKPADPSLKHLEGKDFDAVLVWLERALRGHEALPMVVPGESPEDSILRQDRTLAILTRQDLREACRTLVRRFKRTPVDDDDFVAALLRLAKGFGLTELATDLHALASAEESFASLPAKQQRTLLSTLLDLRAPLPTAFWVQLAARDPGRFGVVAFSAVLRDGTLAALQVLLALPDDEGIADAVYVVLGQHSQSLSPAERDKLVTAARAEAGKSQPSIRAALDEWVDEQPAVQRQEAPRVASSPLDAALAAYAAKRKQTYTPSPACARLVPVREAVCQ